jgi:hypothetical protein
VTDVIDKLGRYDLIFIGDVIEHFTKDRGVELLKTLLSHANKAVVLTTPATEVEQGAAYGNELETHRSLWTEEDFRRLGRCVCSVAAQEILLAVLVAGNTQLPCLSLRVHRASPQRSSFLHRAKKLIAGIIIRS